MPPSWGVHGVARKNPVGIRDGKNNASPSVVGLVVGIGRDRVACVILAPGRGIVAGRRDCRGLNGSECISIPAYLPAAHSEVLRPNTHTRP